MNKGKEKYPYLRIGFSYKIIVEKPLMSGDTLTILQEWRKDTIKDDHPENKNIFREIPKYYGTIVHPEHINYKRDVGGFYNLYEPILYQPKEGYCDTVLMFLKHIFQNQLEIGLDYLTILYRFPTQPLPITCLISAERKTGKTTFLELLKAIFGGNMTINFTQDLQSRFNSDLSGKLLIGVEEVLFEKLEDTERFKYLSTSKSFKSEAKNKDREEVHFYGKFVLLSNHVDNFIKIEPGEDRFWVIKVKPFEKEIVNLLDKMKNEIPQFLHYILQRKISTSNNTRMWFDFKDYETEALRRVINHNKNRVEIELVNIFLTIIENFEEDKICFQPNDLANYLSKSYLRTDLTQIRKLVKEKWKLVPVSNSLSYKRFILLSDGSFSSNIEKGRYYTITKDWIKENYDDLMN